MDKLRAIFKKVCEWLKVVKEKTVAGVKALIDKAIKAYVEWKIKKRRKDKKK